MGALLAPLEASAEQVAAAAATGAEEAAEAAAAPASSVSSSSFDAAAAAASLVSALVARGSLAELSSASPRLLDAALSRLLALPLPEVSGGEGEGEGGQERGSRNDWRLCALPAAAACLASAGAIEAASGIAAAHTGAAPRRRNLSACLPLLRSYLRAMVLPPLCDPRGAAAVAASLAAAAPAPGAVAAVWRGLPGAAAAALRVLEEVWDDDEDGLR